MPHNMWIFFKGEIVKIVPELSSSAQFRLSTIKRANLVPMLSKWVRSRPYAELAILSSLAADGAVHRGMPTQHKDENKPICIVQGLNLHFDSWETKLSRVR